MLLYILYLNKRCNTGYSVKTFVFKAHARASISVTVFHRMYGKEQTFSLLSARIRTCVSVQDFADSLRSPWVTWGWINWRQLLLCEALRCYKLQLFHFFMEHCYYWVLFETSQQAVMSLQLEDSHSESWISVIIVLLLWDTAFITHNVRHERWLKYSDTGPRRRRHKDERGQRSA